MTIAKLGLKPPSPSETQNTDPRHPKILEAARMYEGQFLREMVRAMKKTVPESEFMPESQAEKIFREQLDEQTVDSWVDRGGVGMADLIYDQIMEKYGMAARPQRPQGPLPIQKTQDDVKVVSKTTDATTYKIQPKVSSYEITAPWDGKVIGSQSLEHGLSSLLLDHTNNEGVSLKSSLLYKGSLLAPEFTEVKAGQRIGLLNPSNDGVLWRVQTL